MQSLKFKFIWCKSICLALLLMFGLHSQLQATPTQRTYVDDQASILGSNKTSIQGKLIDLEERTGKHVLLMTRAEFAGATSIEKMAESEFRKIASISKVEDSLVLFLIVTNQKKMQVHSGPKLNLIVNSREAARALNYAVLPESSSEEEGVGIERAVDAIIVALKPSLWTTILRSPILLAMIGAAALAATYGAIAFLIQRRRRAGKPAEVLRG